MNRLNVIVLLAAASLLTGRAAAAQATFICPTTAAGSFVAEVRLDAGPTALGAYSMTLTYPPNVLTIESGSAVAGGEPAVPTLSDGSPNPFSSMPTAINLMTAGSARINAFQIASVTEPTGLVSVARITFSVLTTNPSATISLSASLADAGTSRRFATVTSSCSVGVGVTDPPSTTPTSSTTTSSTTTTIPGSTCPRGRRFWKNHPSAWPVGTLMLGSQTYSEGELLAVLRTPSGRGRRSDASLILAHQLIAAKLNIANGSDPTAIMGTVADADGLLAAFGDKLPYGVRPSSIGGHAMVDDGGLLHGFNDGRAAIVRARGASNCRPLRGPRRSRHPLT